MLKLVGGRTGVHLFCKPLVGCVPFLPYTSLSNKSLPYAARYWLEVYAFVECQKVI